MNVVVVVVVVVVGGGGGGGGGVVVVVVLVDIIVVEDSQTVLGSLSRNHAAPLRCSWWSFLGKLIGFKLGPSIYP